jgi:cellulose synthase/poly-beta-1,6-N-acetylglucosamine synthase-like glycosyltransferase
MTGMTTVALALIALPVTLGLLACVAYPVALRLLGLGRRMPSHPDPGEWPELTIHLPVHNEEQALPAALESLLALDYPAERRHILVVSDCSTDRTDEIALTHASRGVKLVRQSERKGKTAAENLAAQYVRGDLVVCTDATTRIRPASLKALVRPFADPAIGVVSGRDVSVGSDASEVNRGEARYVGYEMWVRDLETRLGTIVGASGCLFAIRRSLFEHQVPEALSRDFSSPLIARLHGFSTVSAPDAVCDVPRAGSLMAEFRRKTRTMARGLETLWHYRALLNPFRYGRFAVMLAVHKLLRWIAFLTLPLAVVGLALLAVESWPARVVVAGGIVLLIVGIAAHFWPGGRRPPRLVALIGFLVGAQGAAVLAWSKALRGERSPVWNPTRRA